MSPQPASRYFQRVPAILIYLLLLLASPLLAGISLANGQEEPGPRQQTLTPPGLVPSQNTTATPTVTPTASPRPVATQCDPATFGGIEMHLAVDPDEVLAGQTFTIRLGFKNFGALDAGVGLRNIDSGEAVGVGWDGGIRTAHDMRVSAPPEGTWSVSGSASGEGHACIDGRIIYGHTHVGTTQPVTLTVAGAMVYIPTARKGRGE